MENVIHNNAGGEWRDLELRLVYAVCGGGLRIVTNITLRWSKKTYSRTLAFTRGGAVKDKNRKIWLILCLMLPVLCPVRCH